MNEIVLITLIILWGLLAGLIGYAIGNKIGYSKCWDDVKNKQSWRNKL